MKGLNNAFNCQLLWQNSPYLFNDPYTSTGPTKLTDLLLWKATKLLSIIHLSSRKSNTVKVSASFSDRCMFTPSFQEATWPAFWLVESFNHDNFSLKSFMFQCCFKVWVHWEFARGPCNSRDPMLSYYSLEIS